MGVIARIRQYVVGAIVPIAGAISLMGMPAQPALAASQACNTNSVIPGGISGIQDLKQTYTQNPCGDVQQLYNYFGITSASQFTGMVFGHVDTANNVYVDTQKDTVHTRVATNAITAGRDDISNSNGSSIAILGGKFYKRPPAVSFASGTLNALIKLDANGRFLFAVITSCGNPVVGKPTTQQPKPQPQKPTPSKPTPNQPIPTPPATTPSTPAPTQQQPTSLPDTGAGSVAALFGIASSLGFLGYRTYLQRRVLR